MRFNAKNTALSFLDPKEQMDFFIPENEHFNTKYEELKFKQSLIDGFKKPLVYFNEKVQYISEAFLLAYEKGRHKLADIFDKEPVTDAGTLIFNTKSSNGILATNTLFYTIQTKGTGDDWSYQLMLCIFQHSKQHPQQILTFLHIDAFEQEFTKTFCCKGYKEMGCDKRYWTGFLIGFIIFCKYCEVETKMVAPNRREHHVGVKYLNETKNNIQIMDATWFTTIVRSEGFKVGAETGGFFRWQPVGVGKTGRKLMWIMPYEKEGYVRKAKVLLHEKTRDE